MTQSGQRKANRLINEKSPYLLQHAHNPVDWHPWNEEAFEKARSEDKPVFLSIGYSTCHWCHVMEKDSFENEAAADLINEHFIPVKVDREERPDLDQKYMAACQALTGQGGWPLTVFLTPDKKPFYAATFIPRTARYGMNGLMDILPRLSEFWKKDRDRVVKAGEDLVNALQQIGGGPNGKAEAGQGSGNINEKDLPGKELLERAVDHFKGSYDREFGGFGQAPKFPAPHQLVFLLRRNKRNKDDKILEMVLNTLRAMHRGGIFDQLGYGIHRYSVDEKWLVPHFEKMLYDQALVAIAALEAYRASGDEEMADFAREIFGYVLSEMRSQQGAFYAAEDADSEGQEGTFYVWRLEELKEILGKERGDLIAAYFGVTGKGNFENGTSILHRSKSNGDFADQYGIPQPELEQAVEESRKALFEVRGRRERPFRDDKILTSWNGLMIAALAAGSRILEEPKYLEAAEKAALFVKEKMFQPDGRLLRRYRDGEAGISAFLDDYAYLAWGYLELYRAGSNPQYLEEAERLARLLLDEFRADSGYLHFSAGGEEPADFGLEAEAYDGAMPSGWSTAVLSLLQLGRMLPDEDLAGEAENLIKLQQDKLERYPTGFSYLLTALDYALHASEESLYCSQDGDCGWE